MFATYLFETRCVFAEWLGEGSLSALCRLYSSFLVVLVESQRFSHSSPLSLLFGVVRSQVATEPFSRWTALHGSHFVFRRSLHLTFFSPTSVLSKPNPLSRLLMLTTGPTSRYQIKSPTNFPHVRRHCVFGSLPSRQETEPSPLIGCWCANSAHEDFGDEPLLYRLCSVRQFSSYETEWTLDYVKLLTVDTSFAILW